jgi:Na+/H+ antiporter NhaD/arsenite permease-like protein
VAAALAVVIFAVAYLLIATEWIHRTAVALGGAGLMLLLHVTTSDEAFFSHVPGSGELEVIGVDWNVIFLLLGMMVIVSVLRTTGVFGYLAIWTAKRARGRPYRLMVLLVVLVAIASALLDNVTTVLLIAPVTFEVCRRLDLPAAPYLIAEVLASNIGGAATLVGDPPNIIIASRAGLSFNGFLVNMAPLVVMLMAVYCVACRWLFRGAFRYDAGRVRELMAVRERDLITDGRVLARSVAVLALVMAAFVLHPVLHYEPSVVALLGAGLTVAVTRVPVAEALREVEWPTLAFFAGLFIMVGGLVETGVVGRVSQAIADRVGGQPAAAAMLLLWGSAALSAIVDNIPYVATMSPVVSDLAAQAGPQGGALWWALALGADLGGNATAVGASANVVALGIAEREGQRISFWQFSRYGLPVTLLTVGLSVPYLWLRYL